MVIVTAIIMIVITLTVLTIIAIIFNLSSSRNKLNQDEEKEPTKILTIGAEVKYRGEVWEITGFMTDSRNQTLAEIEKHSDWRVAMRRTIVPVEELEGVEE